MPTMFVFGAFCIVTALSVQTNQEKAVLAIAAFQQGDQGRATDLIGEILQGDQATGHELLQRFVLALLAFGDGEFSAVLTHLNGLENDMPEVSDFVWSLRARTQRALNRWSEARAMWSLVLQKTPFSPLVSEARYGIADAYYAEGLLTEALNKYREALRSYPNSDRATAAWYNTARIAESLRRYRDAAQAYSVLVYQRPTDPLSAPAHDRLKTLIAEGFAAAPSFQLLLSRIDRLLTARALESAALEIEAIQKLANDRNDRLAVKYRRAQLSYYLTDFDEAAMLFDEVGGDRPAWRRAPYERWIARCFAAADRFDEAIGTYLTLAEQYGRRREGRDALYKAAWLTYNSRQYERAIELFQKYLSAFPKNRNADEALWFIGWNYYLLGNLPAANQTMVSLRERFPDSSLVQRTHYWQGRFLHEQKQLQPALASWRETVAQGPLDYYGLMAAQRLEENHQGTGTLSSPNSALAKTQTADTPANTVISPRADAAVFAWTGATGKRILRLMAMGIHDAAAALIATLPAQPGNQANDVAMARARILHGLGAFFEAYRIVAGTFAGAIDDVPDDVSIDFFKLAYPEAHDELVAQSAREFSISSTVLLAVMRQESAFRPDARSFANARGLMQILPTTGEKIAAALGIQNFDSTLLNRPDISIRFGAWYLSRLLENYYGHLVLAISGYNAGPKSVNRWLDSYGGMPTDVFVEQIPFRETRSYVRNVIGNLAVYTRLYQNESIRLPNFVSEGYVGSVDF